MPISPQSEQELLARAYAMAGLPLAQLAADASIPVPRDLRRDKGWIGQLIEWQLGASAGSKPEQDFPELGIELKTIPVDPQGKPLETTFVPVEGSREIPIGERRVGMPLLWSPSEEEDRLLRQDWEELMDMIVLGEVEQISARHGQVMQLRPKAANSKALTRAIGRNGQPIQTLPRGFYLKIDFTHRLLQRHFALPA